MLNVLEQSNSQSGELITSADVMFDAGKKIWPSMSGTLWFSIWYMYNVYAVHTAPLVHEVGCQAAYLDVGNWSFDPADCLYTLIAARFKKKRS